MASPVLAQGRPTRADSAAILLDAATRLESDGRVDAARELYDMILARFAGTPAAAEATRLLGQGTGNRSTPAGRVELQVWTTLYGLWLGVAVPGAFGADEPEPYGIGLLAGGPLGFLAGLGLARSRDLTVGQARAITFGGTWGTWQGYGWANVFDWGEQYDCEFDLCVNDGGSEEKFAGMILGGLAGIGTGLLLSRKTITDGVATSVSLGALWGTWFGVALGVIDDLEGDDLLAAALLGGNAGLVGATLIASHTQMSRNRARLISIAGVIGGLAGGGIDLIAQPDNEDSAIAIPLATSLAGLAIGAIMTKNYDRPAAARGGDLDGALLELDGGDWGMNTPIPTLTTLSARVGGRPVRRPALGLILFRARF